MTYIDGFVIPVPTARRRAGRAHEAEPSTDRPLVGARMIYGGFAPILMEGGAA